MCGIVGYVGERDCVSILIDGLKKLEYRGYDSVGIAVMNADNRVEVVKKQGRVAGLEGEVGNLAGFTGIGHTRWATHGKPSDKNSHPHTSGIFTVVHNGIIENFLELKVDLVNEGARFTSDTDTEVIAHLLEKNYRGNFIEAVRDTARMLKGSYAVAALCEECPGVIAVFKKDNPLIIGRGKGENYIASDIPAISQYTKEVYVLKDGEMALVTEAGAQFFDAECKPVERAHESVDIKAGSLDKGKYESFMLKEIFEIPAALENTVNYLENMELTPEFERVLRETPTVTFIGCGTAYNSALAGRYAIEELARVPVNVEIASEYRYRNPIVEKGSLVVAVSQSGETADTIAAVKLAKERGAFVAVVTNIRASSITNFADFSIIIQAGTEIAVAATKSYNCQLLAFYRLAMLMAAFRRGTDVSAFETAMRELPALANQLWVNSEKIVSFAGRFSKSHSVFFLGRGLDYAVAVEGSLKLKEISYIHSEGYASGELKHGTLALIEQDTLVVILMTQRELAKKTLNALHEVKARGATVFVLTQYDDVIANEGVDFYLKLPESVELFEPVLEIVPLQLFAYYMARARGNDPDKPRNLAKSVTVE